MPVTRRVLAVVEPPKPEPSKLEQHKRAYNVREAAVYCGVSVWQIRQWVAAQELKPGRVGNGANPRHIFDKAALDRHLDKIFGID
jgi:hypothetical protein